MALLDTILNLISSLISKQGISVGVTIPIPVPESSVKGPEIDWSNPDCKISDHFTVKEALWLPSWQVMHIPSEDEKQNILLHAKNMDNIREFLGVSLNVHCWIRPILNNPTSIHHGEDYNAFVKGAKNSAHKIGKACDFDASGLQCIDAINNILQANKLDEFDLRMENNGPNPTWVHIDCMPVISSRYFIP